MNEIFKVEIALASASDAFLAKSAGAFRVELNSALSLSGLTPSMGEFLLARESGIKIIAMVRPRRSGFLYDNFEFKTMLKDAELFMKNGASGIAFGFLTRDGKIDKEKTKAMVKTVGDGETVFHRAFDVAQSDFRPSLETLIDCSVTRVLTGGKAKTAILGAKNILDMNVFSAGAIEILPGGGIRAKNALTLVKETGCPVVHASCARLEPDITEELGKAIGVDFTPQGLERGYFRLDKKELTDLVRTGMSK
ncbi:MAG: copper homeostasis protein CutC [Clostridia bacterium]